MCAIAGYLQNRSSRQSEEILFEMIGRLRHRGPDGSGAFFDRGVALGHARLSIIDPQGGAQPLASEDGSLWIVYAGEAFNYLELREELRRRGYRFATTTDTEVVLYLYQEYGPAALEKINGQFALAIWNRRSEELFLARDRLGIRPLYYTRSNGRFLFASEIKALMADPDVPRRLDPDALAQVFTFWTTLPSRTAFRGICELPPGHFMTLRGAALRVRRWWHLPCPPIEERWGGTFEEAREELSALLTDAVRVRLRADVPVGSYLSGGLDSSIVSVLAADAAPGRLRTFSVGFEESALDESSSQMEMAEQLGAEHSRLLVTNEAMREHFVDAVLHCERPIARTAPVPLFLLSEMVRRSGYKVVLSGEGADEVFGGYNIFKEAKIRDFWAREPGSRSRPLLLQRLYPYIFQNHERGWAFVQRFFAVSPRDRDDPLLSHRIRWQSGARRLAFLSDEARAALGEDPLAALSDLLPTGFGAWGPFERAQWLEMTIFLCEYLLASQGDRVAMAHSVEARHPFLDVRIVEFAARLPPHWKMRALSEKRILREAFRPLLPPRVAQRPKHPYRAPVREIFFPEKPGSLLQHLLSVDALRDAGLFHPDRTTHLVRKLSCERGASIGEGDAMALSVIASAQSLHYAFVKNSLRPVCIERPERIVRIDGDQRRSAPPPPSRVAAGEHHG